MNDTSKNENLSAELIKEKTKENFRATIIDLGLELAAEYSTADRFNAVEIGCMFKTNEGFSTYKIASFIKKVKGQKRFISIEYESEHINSCKQMLLNLDPDLLHNVQFLCGKSLDILSNAIQETGSLDFVLLDGGANPEYCLKEFELIVRQLSENGLIIIDDLQNMAPTGDYPHPRPFGKGTLILPYMIIAEYIKAHNKFNQQNDITFTKLTKLLDSELVANTASSELLWLLGSLEYLIITKAKHKMLIVGRHSILETLRNKHIPKKLPSVEVTPTRIVADSSLTNDHCTAGNVHSINNNISNNTYTPMQKQSPEIRKTLQMFANKYSGRRAFIIGNGPSLNSMDLTKLKNEVTFGVNSIFYNFDRMGFKPTFYVVEDKLVAEDRADEINALTGMTKIFGTGLQYCLNDSQDSIWANVIYDFSNYPGFPHFSKDASQCLWVGGTVSYLCMQLAYYMGFSEVYLIGFDHNYTIPSDANVEGTVITSSSNDPNHFHPEYFGKGKRWHDPRLDRMEKAYNKAKETFEASGRRIINATKGGKLEVFPRVNYDSLFNTFNGNQLPFNNHCICTGNTTQPAHYPETFKSGKLQYRPDKPFSHLVLDYTRLCNSRCTYCGIWKSKNEPELSLDAIEKTFASLKTYGLSTCYVTGGEPYISDKILDIARIMHHYLPRCRLSGATNAVQPQQILARMDKILRMGIPLQVHISINGSEATHDATRGCPGFWKKAIYLLDTLKANGVKVVASMSLMPQTIEDLPYMQEFCAERGVELMFSWVRQSPRYGTVDQYYSIWPEELKSKLHKIEYLPDEFDCVGLSNRLVIVPDGSVYPCEVYHPEILLGNINEQSLESMLNSPRTASMAQMITDKKCYWCQGAGDTGGSPKWMLMDCYRRHSRQATELAQKYPQAVRMAPQESRKVIEEILSSKSTHYIPTSQKQENTQAVMNCDNKGNKVRVSAIVCTYRNPDLLTKTLESLNHQTINQELFEIIVVDNNSQDNTTNVVASFPSVRYLHEQKLGLSHARNAGIKAAYGDIIAFIDDDAEASPGWAEALLEIYDSIPQVWAAGGNVLPIWDAEQPLWLTEEHHRFLSLVDLGQTAHPLQWPDRIIGTNCSFRRHVFEDIGYFNTDLGRLGGLLLSMEDTEIQQRIHQTGHLVYYSPEATVYHHVPAGRMTREGLSKRTIGNSISEMLVILLQTGREEHAEQFLDWVRNKSTQISKVSSCDIEERILEKAFSTFVLELSDIPIEVKVKFTVAIGTYYSKQQKYEQALDKYTHALLLPNLPKPKVGVFLVRQGNIYLEQEMYEQAEQKFNECISIEQISDETKFYSLKGLGICYGHKGHFELMERKYEEILALPNIPDNEKADAMRAFGQCYFKHQKYKEAEYIYLRMLGRVNGTHSYQIIKGLGLSYAAQNRFEEMDEKLNEILTSEDFSITRKIDAAICFGGYYLEQKKYQQAEDLFIKINNYIGDRKDYQILKSLGITYGCQSRFSEMEQIINQIMISEDIENDNKVDAANYFGGHYLENNNYQQAEQLYLKVLNLAEVEDKHQILKGLGDCYGAQGRFSEMEQKSREILSLQEIPNNLKIDAMLSFCRHYYARGMIEPADKLYSTVYSWDNLDDLSKYHLVLGYGNICFEYGRLSQSMEKFNEALSINNVSQEEKFWVLAAFARLDLLQNRFAQAQRRFEELFFNNIYTNRQKVVLASDFVNYYATKGNRDKIMEIYKQICSLIDITHDDKSLFANRVKDALQRVQENPQQNSHPTTQENIDKKIHISVIVCTYQNPELLGKTLDSLNRQTLNQNLFEVIVVDNNSQDLTPNVVSRYPSVIYLQEQRQGLSFARNTGAEAARGDIIAFIDDDAEASEGWLEALLTIYEAIPDAWAVGGKVLPIWDAPKPDWITEDKFRQLSLVGWGDTPRPLHWPERIIGTNCSFRRQVFSDIGFFDTGLGRISTVLLGNEDTEIQQRIHALGRLVYYTPDAVVYHHVPAYRMTREYFQRRSEGTIFSQNIMSLRSQGKDREVEKINAELRRNLQLADFAKKQQQVLNESNELLSQYKDRHRGQRCVIIGNGPSLNKMDLSFLKNEITFGMNRIYLLFDKWDFMPTYYVSVNPLVIEQSAEQICKITSPKFLGLNGLPYIQNHRDIIFLQSIRRPSFSRDPRNGLWEGHTVTYVAMQLAYFMGFKEVILIGVDHYFKSQGPANQEVISQGDDPNHFHPQYFGKGVRWNLPDLAKSELAYSLAKQAFESDGRRILDATVDGHLTIFPKAEYRQIFLPVSLTTNNDELFLNAALIDTEFKERIRDKNENLNTIVRPNFVPSVPAEPRQEYLVSAIVSTYNSERFLRGCLDDLEQQTIADKLEIIVVNSGSQENEEAIVHEYQQKFNNIIYIKTEQREGIYTAWNRAVSVARGTFLTNANTDDRHREDALEIMAETLQVNPDVGLVYGDQICTDTQNGTFAKHHVTETARRPEYSRERLLFGCCVGSQPMWRKSLHNELGNFDESLNSAGDWDFWLRISSKYKFKHIPDFLGLYYHNYEGIEHGRKIHSLYERYIVGKRYGNPYISVIPLYKSKDNPLVSVIMPAYNAAAHIAESIESVLIQNYRDLELIVVDDGSTDNTNDIVTGFKDNRIKYFYKNNSGPSGTRNLAISKARGQYIMPLDADDMMTPDSIARHLMEFENHPDVDLVYCDVLLIDDRSKPIQIMNIPEYRDRRHLIRDLFRAGHPILPFRLGIRRNVFDKIGFYDEDLLIGEDYDMMRRFIMADLKAHHLSEPLHLRRMHTDSLSRNSTAQKVKSHFKAVKRFVDSFSYNELFPDVNWDEIPADKRQLRAKCLIVANYLAIGQNYINSNSASFYANIAFEYARSELLDCLKIDPDNPQIREMLQKCEIGIQKCEKKVQHAVCQA